MIVYTSEKERCCSANKGIARERERHGDAQTRLHLHRSAPTVESEIPIAAIAVTNIPRVGGTKVFVACGGGGGGATSTRRRTFHGPQRITRNLDESLASCNELEGSDATMSMAPGRWRSRRLLLASAAGIYTFETPIRGDTQPASSRSLHIRSWKARASSATRVKPVSSSTMTTKKRKPAGENDRGKARRNHEISFDRAD
ncbi:Uncharacterized protein DBV15_02762, partial [Temnothorax longispinosus]